MGTSRALILVMIACATAAACKRNKERREPAPLRAGSAAVVPTGDDARFVIATPAITTRATPARRSRTTPATCASA